MGERNFGLDSLKSILNRDIEEKGIVLPELSCRTATELPLLELPDCRQVPPTGAAGLPPNLPRQSCRTAARASAAVRQFRRTPCQAVTWQTDKLDIHFCMEYPCFLNARTSPPSARLLFHKILAML